MREVLEEPIEQKTIFSEYNEKFPSWNFQIEYLCYWIGRYEPGKHQTPEFEKELIFQWLSQDR